MIVERRGSAPRPDEQLVADVRAGDTSAFGELYSAHVGAVRGVAYAHVRDADAVADIVQDTFARALQHLEALREVHRFRPWLLSIARHVAVDRLRAAKRVVALDDEHAESLVSGEVAPDALAELGDLAQRVRGSVAGLSQRDATAVALVTQLGFAPEEVGAALGVSSGAAKVIVHRARRRLRHALLIELLEEQPWLGCDEYQTLSRSGASASDRHLLDCGECIEAARVELLSQRPS